MDTFLPLTLGRTTTAIFTPPHKKLFFVGREKSVAVASKGRARRVNYASIDINISVLKQSLKRGPALPCPEDGGGGAEGKGPFMIKTSSARRPAIQPARPGSPLTLL